MTLIQRPSEAQGKEKMDGSKEDNGKSMRPVRNRRYTRLVKMSHYFQSSVDNNVFVRHFHFKEHWHSFVAICEITILIMFLFKTRFEMRKHHVSSHVTRNKTIFLQFIFRRCLVAGQRPQKRLFTPEIKRYLKDWLVRRRENPYPNREEKKILSRETGLTYIQVRVRIILINLNQVKTIQ